MNLVQDLWNTVAWLLSERELRSLALSNKALYNSLANHTRWETLINELIEPRRIETSNTHCLCVRESDGATSRWRGKSLLDYYNLQKHIEKELIVKKVEVTPGTGSSCNKKTVMIVWPVNSGRKRLVLVHSISPPTVLQYRHRTAFGRLSAVDCISLERIDLVLRSPWLDVVQPAYRKYKLIRHSLSLPSLEELLSQKAARTLTLTLQDENLSEFDYETTMLREIILFNSFYINQSKGAFRAHCAAFTLYHAKMPMRLEQFEMLKSQKSVESAIEREI